MTWIDVAGVEDEVERRSRQTTFTYETEVCASIKTKHHRYSEVKDTKRYFVYLDKMPKLPEVCDQMLLCDSGREGCLCRPAAATQYLILIVWILLLSWKMLRAQNYISKLFVCQIFNNNNKKIQSNSF